MAESIANHLTAPLLRALGSRAQQWQMRSGISLVQHREFLARSIDMLITGSSQLEDVEEIEHHPIMEEPFVIVAPAAYADLSVSIEAMTPLPFVRYSLLSAMGQRIERQLARMKLRIPNVIEVDSTHQQLSTVIALEGWSIATPLCLASQIELLPSLTVLPMPRGSFRRRIQLVARKGEFGDLPRDMALQAAAILRGGKVESLIRMFPWIEGAMAWEGPPS